VNTLLNGRLVYDHRKSQFRTLSPFLVFIEGTSHNGDLSRATEEFFGQIVTIQMKKSKDNDAAIINQVCFRFYILKPNES
jgi:hypothetical protein